CKSFLNLLYGSFYCISRVYLPLNNRSIIIQSNQFIKLLFPCFYHFPINVHPLIFICLILFYRIFFILCVVFFSHCFLNFSLVFLSYLSLGVTHFVNDTTLNISLMINFFKCDV